ncbi:four helix bundle protein [Paralcaligenes ginsengisoli]
MAIHTDLSIYELASDLLDVAVDLTCNFPRNVRNLGLRINDACISMIVLIAQANAARNKVPFLDELLEHLHVVEILLRLSLSKRFIVPKQYARAAGVCNRIGKQAGGWRKSSAARPVV